MQGFPFAEWPLARVTSEDVGNFMAAVNMSKEVYCSSQSCVMRHGGTCAGVVPMCVDQDTGVWMSL